MSLTPCSSTPVWFGEQPDALAVDERGAVREQHRDPGLHVTRAVPRVLLRHTANTREQKCQCRKRAHSGISIHTLSDSSR